MCSCDLNKNNVIASTVDGIGQGIGYTLSIVILAAIRELFGSGTLLGARIIPEDYTIGILTQPPSAFILLGIIIAIFTILTSNQKEA